MKGFRRLSTGLLGRPPGAGLRKMFWVIACLCLWPQTASAHPGLPPAPHDLGTAWNWEPTILLGLGGSAWLYGRGVRAMTARGRGTLRMRTRSFWAGLAVLFIALVSPLDSLGSALFSAHMAQHMLLMLIAPPLLVAGFAVEGMWVGLSSTLRKRMGGFWRRTRRLRTLSLAWGLHLLALWLWHVPSWYQAALQHEGVHMLEHLSFLGTALLFWHVVLRSHTDRDGAGIFGLFTMALASGLLGALITFAPTPWYPAYAQTTLPWGLTPLEDQQLAGAIMWLPGGVVYTLAALYGLGRRLFRPNFFEKFPR